MKKSIFIWIALSFFGNLSAQGLSFYPGTTRAVVIGISDYQNEDIPDLQYAHVDAEAFAAYLQSPAGGGLKQNQLRLLINEKATTGQIAAALDWLMEVSNENDKAIIYFSGHGDVETKTNRNLGFLLTYDSPAQIYIAGAYPIFYIQVILETLAEKGVTTIMMSDACRAGELAGSEIGGAQATAANLARQFANEIKIMSCQSNEYSLEGKQWGGGRGAFSYHLIEGLMGLADRNQDGVVNLLEIENYLEDIVPKETAPFSQIPITVGNKGSMVSIVDGPLLAQLKERKAAQPPLLEKIAMKSLAETLLEKADTSIQELYSAFEQAIEQGNLLEPEGRCANYYYEKLIHEESIQSLHSLMKRNFAAALQDEAQQALYTYLDTNKEELNTRSVYRTTKGLDMKFSKFPLRLAKAAELLGPSHYMYKNLLAKQYFFEGENKYYSGLHSAQEDSLLNLALVDYEHALSYEPGSAHVLLSMGKVYHAKKNYEKALHYVNEALKYSPNWAFAWRRLGQIYLSLGYGEKAENAYNKAIELKPDYANGYYQLGYYYTFFRYDFEKAESYYHQAITIDSAYSWGYYGLGQLHHYKLHAYDEAMGYYLKTLSIDSTNMYAPVGLAQLYEKKGDYDTSIGLLEKALKIRPDFPMYLSELGRYHHILGRTEKAKVYYQLYIDKSKNKVSAYYGLGYPFRLHSENELAEQYLRKALDIDSTTFVFAYWDLAWVLYSTNRKQEAYDLLNKGIGLLMSTSDKRALFYLRGLLKYYEGKVKESLISFQKAEEIQTPDVTSNRINIVVPQGLILAVEKVAEKDVAGAIPYFEEVVKKQPRTDNPKYMLCQLKIGQGDFDEALDLLEQALQIRGRTYDFMANDPQLAPIRDMPRYKELMRRFFPEKQ